MIPLTTPGQLGKSLTPGQQHAIVAAVASGRTQRSVAQDAGVNPKTVERLIRDARQDGSTLWKKTLHDAVQPASETIALAVSDREDIHKAAADSFKLLTGMGLLNGDTPGTVINVLTVVNQALPSDLQFDIVSTDDAIDAQATDSTQEIE